MLSLLCFRGTNINSLKPYLSVDNRYLKMLLTSDHLQNCCPMKKLHNPTFKILSVFLLFFIASTAISQQSYREVNGSVRDAETGDLIKAATITIAGTNQSTVTNAEGNFLLKTLADSNAAILIVRAVGYDEKRIKIPVNEKKSLKIKLATSTIKLDETSIIAFSDAKNLVQKVFAERQKNYQLDKTVMTAFYRETIKKRNKNASLAEAVVNIYKQSYGDKKKDQIKLLRSRKNTDYSRLDTISLKLQGGPFSTLYVDLMKYPEYIFTPATMDAYTFRFGKVTEIDGQLVYVIRFKQRAEVLSPLYNGNLYIGANSLAMVKAVYSLSLDNTKEVNDMFIKSKPADVYVKPTQIDYEVNYREKNGTWHYGYSKANLSFEVKKRRRLFKSTYSLSCEMAITDWKLSSEAETWLDKGNIDESIIMADHRSGFGDPEFWGEYNVIEPEKSIESAIKKIRRNIEREEDRASLGGK